MAHIISLFSISAFLAFPELSFNMNLHEFFQSKLDFLHLYFSYKNTMERINRLADLLYIFSMLSGTRLLTTSLILCHDFHHLLGLVYLLVLSIRNCLDLSVAFFLVPFLQNRKTIINRLLTSTWALVIVSFFFFFTMLHFCHRNLCRGCCSHSFCPGHCH